MASRSSPAGTRARSGPRPRALTRPSCITPTSGTTTTATGTRSRRSRRSWSWTRSTTCGIHRSSTTSTSRTAGSRLFLPPYLDPIEPNVDPLLVDGVNALGTAMAWELAGEGTTGIAINAIYDAWTPARAYQHYHGGVRILSEAASANLASPIEVPFEQLATRAR